jgi:putative membrane protein
MPSPSFFSPEVRAEAAAAVKDLESKSGAEVVIAVRLRSGSYRHCDYLFGFLLSLAALGAVLLVPQPFRAITLPIDVVLTFALGAVLSAYSPFLERVLATSAFKREQVQTAARAAFYDLRVSHTCKRTGILVYLSLLERRAEVVCDSGIDRAQMAEAWERALGGINAAARAREPAAFLAAVRGLGAPLSSGCPRRADDANELPDEMSAP